MRDVSDTRPTPPADASVDAIVTDDLTCIGCAYNLRTLPHAGQCPECGQAVSDSLNIDDLRYAPTTYLAHLATATVRLHQCCDGVLFVTVPFMLAIILMYADERWSVLLWPLPFVVLALLLVGWFALWNFTRRDPRRTRHRPESPARRLVRVALVVAVGWLPVMVGGAVLSGWLASVGIAAVAFATALVTPVIIGRWARELADGVGEQQLRRSIDGLTAITYMCGFLAPVAAGCAGNPYGALLIATAVLLPIVLAWRVLFGRLGKALQVAARESAAREQAA